MAKVSAGLVMYRRRGGRAEILLIHPGGPYWRGKDLGAWSIPKGEIESGEDALYAAKREFEEETGLRPEGEFYPLKPVKLRSRKTIFAWFFQGDFDPATLNSVTFPMEWPPRSGRMEEFPEADGAQWFTLEEGKLRISAGQRSFVEELESALQASSGHPQMD
jgi:predicted NUDIX family NTP pyrophosphohydrolase